LIACIAYVRNKLREKNGITAATPEKGGTK
jgi:hypothetical protein